MRNVRATVHGSNKDSLVPRGIRLLRSQWAELEAIRLRRGLDSVQDVVREAVESLITSERAA